MKQDKKEKIEHCEAIYVSEKILPKAPPLPQQFVETRWTYIHQALKWWMRYGRKSVQLGRRVLEYIPKNDTHFRIWEDVPRMSQNPILKVERVTLLELLDRLIIPALEQSQKGDEELNFSSGYLARLWPRQVLSDLKFAQLMLEEPDFAMPLTKQAIEDNLEGDASIQYSKKSLNTTNGSCLQQLG